MPGTDFCNSKHTYTIGDPVWIFVDNVNTPTGRWKGEITDVFAHGSELHKYYSVQAKIVDGKKATTYSGYYPSSNYRVMPRNEHTTALIDLLDEAESNNKSISYHNKIRETAFKEALSAVAMQVAKPEIEKIVELVIAQKAKK